MARRQCRIKVLPAGPGRWARGSTIGRAEENRQDFPCLSFVRHVSRAGSLMADCLRSGIRSRFLSSKRAGGMSRRSSYQL